MRSLAKPVKSKGPPQQQPSNTAKPAGKDFKPQSKKIMKTVFHSPFRYKIQTLSVEDCEQVTQQLVAYAKAIRSETGMIVKAVKNEQFISFNSKVKQEKPTLVTKHFLYGVKQCLTSLKKKQDTLKLIIFFYDDTKHDLFEELMCHIIYHRVPYVLLRSSETLKEQLGLKKLLVLGLTEEQQANQIEVYSCKCLIEIPWLVDHQWLPLGNNPPKQ